MSVMDELTEPEERYRASLTMIGGITVVVKIIADLLEDFDPEEFEALREEPNAGNLTAYLRGHLSDVADWADRHLNVIDQVEALLSEEDE